MQRCDCSQADLTGDCGGDHLPQAGLQAGTSTNSKHMALHLAWTQIHNDFCSPAMLNWLPSLHRVNIFPRLKNLHCVIFQQLQCTVVGKESARRYFEAVQGHGDHKGELFGLKNLFRMQVNGTCLTRKILEVRLPEGLLLTLLLNPANHFSYQYQPHVCTQCLVSTNQSCRFAGLQTWNKSLTYLVFPGSEKGEWRPASPLLWCTKVKRRRRKRKEPL